MKLLNLVWFLVSLLIWLCFLVVLNQSDDARNLFEGGQRGSEIQSYSGVAKNFSKNLKRRIFRFFLKNPSKLEGWNLQSPLWLRTCKVTIFSSIWGYLFPNLPKLIKYQRYFQLWFFIKLSNNQNIKWQKLTSIVTFPPQTKLNWYKFSS